MTMTKNYADRTITFGCDECGITFEADGLDFYEAYEEFKAHGGIARNDGGDWEHRCEGCR